MKQTEEEPVNPVKRLGVVLLVGLVLGGCSTTGPGGKKSVILIGETEERDIGAKMDAQIRAEKKIYTDPLVNDYVNRTGQHIATLSDRPEIPYQFKVIEDKTLNAFAVPGGDEYGTIYMARSGYTPEGMAQVMDKLARLSGSGEGFWETLASDHPPAAKRAAAVRAEIKAKGLDAGLPFDPEPYRTVKSRMR